MCHRKKKNMFKIFQFCLEVDVTPASISALLVPTKYIPEHLFTPGHLF